MLINMPRNSLCHQGLFCSNRNDRFVILKGCKDKLIPAFYFAISKLILIGEVVADPCFLYKCADVDERVAAFIIKIG